MMTFGRKKLYTILLVACAAGYVWLGMNILYPPAYHSRETSICLLKHFTNIPCPSCGSTRSLLSVLKGNFSEGFYLNPLGYLLLLIMLATPVWIVLDLVKRSDSLLVFYDKCEKLLSRKTVAIPAIALVLINWVWNIYKGI